MSRERDEALFAEVVVLIEEFKKATSEANRVQDFNIDTQHLEKKLAESKAVEQRLHAAEKASFSAIKKAGWLSTKSIAICALGSFLTAGFVGGVGGLYLAHKEAKALLAEQRQEEIARFSTEIAAANQLFHNLDELGVRFYADAITWKIDKKDLFVIGEGGKDGEQVGFFRIKDFPEQ